MKNKICKKCFFISGKANSFNGKCNVCLVSMKIVTRRTKACGNFSRKDEEYDIGDGTMTNPTACI